MRTLRVIFLYANSYIDAQNIYEIYDKENCIRVVIFRLLIVSGRRKENKNLSLGRLLSEKMR